MDFLLLGKKIKEFLRVDKLQKLQNEEKLKNLFSIFDDFQEGRLNLPMGVVDIKTPLAFPMGFIEFKKKSFSNSILGVDGGEAEFSRHEGITFDLVSASAFYVDYRKGKVDKLIDFNVSNRDLESPISLKRFFFELEIAKRAVLEFRPKVTLLDGSLVPWPLVRLEKSERDQQLKAWRERIEEIAKETQLVGFIADSNSKEVVSTMERVMKLDMVKSSLLDRELFSTLAEFSPQSRKRFFIYELDFGESLLQGIKIAYCYFQGEVHRLEFFEEGLNFEAVLDQLDKGKGYPVVLKEAHRLAVISQKDKGMILKLINSLSKRLPHFSGKAASKK